MGINKMADDLIKNELKNWKANPIRVRLKGLSRLNILHFYLLFYAIEVFHEDLIDNIRIDIIGRKEENGLDC